MVKETAEVIESLSRGITIRFIKHGECSSCAVSGICGVKDNSMYIEKANGHTFKKGDIIEVEIDEKKTNLASIIVFFIPLVIFILSLFFLRNINEAINFFVSLGIVLVYYFFIRLVLKKKSSYFHIKILNPNNAGSIICLDEADPAFTLPQAGERRIRSGLPKGKMLCIF